MNILVVLPVYNEEASLDRLLARFAVVNCAIPHHLRLVAVDDGSTDRSVSCLERWSEKLPIEILKNGTNRGLGDTIQRGLAHAADVAESDDVVVTMDADNTHPPEMISPMLAKLNSGCDIVIASRYERSSRVVGLSRFRQAMSAGAGIVFQLLVPVPGVRDYTCGYRAYRAELLRHALAKFSGRLSGERGFACMAEILLRCASMKVRIGEVPLELRYDLKASASKMDVPATVGRLLRLAWKNRRLVAAHQSPRRNRVAEMPALPSRLTGPVQPESGNTG